MKEQIVELAALIEWADPGGGSGYGAGVCYHSDVFEFHPFWNHADDETCVTCGGEIGLFVEGMCSHDEFLFWHYGTGYKADWYKHVGRSFNEVGTEVKGSDALRLMLECFEAVENGQGKFECTRRK